MHRVISVYTWKEAEEKRGWEGGREGGREGGEVGKSCGNTQETSWDGNE
jgi:hypothetical protein